MNFHCILLSAAINPKFDLTVNSGFSKSDQRLPQIDNNLIGYQGAAEFNSGFRQCGLDYNCIGKKKENLLQAATAYRDCARPSGPGRRRQISRTPSPADTAQAGTVNSM